MINLFIAVVINNLEAVKVDLAAEEQDVHNGDLVRRSAALRQRLAELESLLRERLHAGALAEPRRAE